MKSNSELTVVWEKYIYNTKLRIQSTALQASRLMLPRLTGLKCHVSKYSGNAKALWSCDMFMAGLLMNLFMRETANTQTFHSWNGCGFLYRFACVRTCVCVQNICIHTQVPQKKGNLLL